MIRSSNAHKRWRLLLYDEIDQTWFNVGGWREKVCRAKTTIGGKKENNFVPCKILCLQTASTTFLVQCLDKVAGAIFSKQRNGKYTYIYNSEFFSAFMQHEGLAGHCFCCCVLQNVTAKNTIESLNRLRGAAALQTPQTWRTTFIFQVAFFFPFRV